MSQQGLDARRDYGSTSRALVAEISLAGVFMTCLNRPAMPCSCSIFYDGTDPAEVWVREQEKKGECILELRLSRKNDVGAVPHDKAQRMRRYIFQSFVGDGSS